MHHYVELYQRLNFLFYISTHLCDVTVYLVTS